MSNKQTITGIFNKIDDLDDSRSLKDLISKIKPILAELAYYSITGDGAVMEMRENWHSNFTGYIKEAIQSNDNVSSGMSNGIGGDNSGIGDSMGGGMGGGMGGSMGSSMSSGMGGGMSSGMGGGMGGGMSGSRSIYNGSSNTSRSSTNPNKYVRPPAIPVQQGYYQQPTFYNNNKKRTTEPMPSSLENIMMGTHISFNNNN